MPKFNLHKILDSHRVRSISIIALAFLALSLALTYWFDYIFYGLFASQFAFICIAALAFLALEFTLGEWFGRKDKNHTMIYFVLLYSSLLVAIGLILKIPWTLISIVSFAFLSLTFAVWFYEKTRKAAAMIYFVLAYASIFAAIGFILRTPWLFISIASFVFLSLAYWSKKRAMYAPMLSCLALAAAVIATFIEMKELSYVLLGLTNWGIVLYLFHAIDEANQREKEESNPHYQSRTGGWLILFFAWLVSLLSFYKISASVGWML